MTISFLISLASSIISPGSNNGQMVDLLVDIKGNLVL
jgi:hypothetical protein